MPHEEFVPQPSPSPVASPLAFLGGLPYFRLVIAVVLVGLAAGTASAGFLVALEAATGFREGHLFLIALLPLGGLAIGILYDRLGGRVGAGNNLILEEIHAEMDGEIAAETHAELNAEIHGAEPRPRPYPIPLRMTPLILGSTLLTHFFGGSAGREGTAVQMGASLADQLSRPFRLRGAERRTLLMAGMAAGFGSIFGTPLAGALFGIEVVAIGRLQYRALGACLLASLIGDRVTAAWGVHHTLYAITGIPSPTADGLLAAAGAGAVFGGIAWLFARATHLVGELFRAGISRPWLRPAAGGALVALAVCATHTTRYIGLGIPTIVESFQRPLPPWDFLAKFAFTSLTLGSGFKGGEVTPLFFIGATLGNALGAILPLGPSLLAGLGFVAVFAGAANTPLSSTLMAMEIFGPAVGIFAGVACVCSYACSGHAGIYPSQRIARLKFPWRWSERWRR